MSKTPSLSKAILNMRNMVAGKNFPDHEQDLDTLRKQKLAYSYMAAAASPAGCTKSGFCKKHNISHHTLNTGLLALGVKRKASKPAAKHAAKPSTAVPSRPEPKRVQTSRAKKDSTAGKGQEAEDEGDELEPFGLKASY